MTRKLLQLLFTTLLLELVVSVPVLAQTPDATIFRLDGVRRVVAIADIHGAYDAFISLLRGSSLVDGELHWSGQDSHLVIVGDVLDRGDGSRQVMDLLMQLEQEAAAAGGAVHMVLGNHEVMNLSGELGYVTRDEFAAYDEFEGSLRRAAQSRFSEQAPGLSRLAVRSAFGQRYPRGFFGHRAAFAPDGRYGSWLLQKPVLLVINDTAFVHAGLSSRLLGSDLDAINNKASTALAEYLGAMQTLMAADVLFPETDFHAHADLAQRYLERGRPDAASDTRRAAEIILEAGANDPFNSDGPVWYRGMVDCSPALEEQRLQQVLDALDVERLIIGHTPTRNHLVQERFDSSLIMADTGMLNSYFGGQPAAVILENGDLSVYYAEQNQQSQPVPMPRLVGERPLSVSDDELADMLGTADIAESEAGAGIRRLTLRSSRGEVNVLFNPALASGNGEPFVPEVAAYRLDRLLGMDMVPVAVLREIDGQSGAIFVEQDRSSGQTEQNISPEAWCSADEQHGLMQIFDFVLNKQNRLPAQMRYMTGNGKLVINIDSGILNAGAPIATPGDAAESLVSFVRDRLITLTPELLEEQLGDVLDTSRRQALLDRRDLILNSGDR